MLGIALRNGVSSFAWPSRALLSGKSLVHVWWLELIE